jgi:hypothetical protein
VDGSVDKQLPAKGEDPLYWHAFREFKGVYTRSDRTAMPEDNFYDLENLMPVGSANMHIVPNISASLAQLRGRHDLLLSVRTGCHDSVPHLLCE